MINKTSELKMLEIFNKGGVVTWKDPDGCHYRYEKERARVGQRDDKGNFDWWHLDKNSLTEAKHKVIELINE
jgi:hypothetical protein